MEIQPSGNNDTSNTILYYLIRDLELKKQMRNGMKTMKYLESMCLKSVKKKVNSNRNYLTLAVELLVDFKLLAINFCFRFK
jgi:hypothetical protein